MEKSSSKLRMKLFVDKANEKVLFAEASKEVVHFLFSILALPVAHVISLLSKHSMVGCLTNLYHSVESLDDTYLQDNQHKNILLKPPASPAFNSASALTWIDGSASQTRTTYYRCANANYVSSGTRFGCGYYFADDFKAACPFCGRLMDTPLTYVPSVVAKAGISGGVSLVKSIVTCMVTDDLNVTPMSTTSVITMLNRYGVKEVGSLEERTVYLGMTEGVKLLKASLQSTTVLTDVFLGKREHEATSCTGGL